MFLALTVYMADSATCHQDRWSGAFHAASLWFVDTAKLGWAINVISTWLFFAVSKCNEKGLLRYEDVRFYFMALHTHTANHWTHSISKTIAGSLFIIIALPNLNPSWGLISQNNWKLECTGPLKATFSLWTQLVIDPSQSVTSIHLGATLLIIIKTCNLHNIWHNQPF